MKKTVNVNIASQPFIMDEEAYNDLASYLADIASRLPASDTGSMDNIESRIARLFDARIKAGRQIIELGEVYEAKAVVGLPESFGHRRTDTSSHVDAEQIIEDAEEIGDVPATMEEDMPSYGMHRRELHTAVAVREEAQSVVGQTQTAVPAVTEPAQEPYDYPTHLYRSRDERMLAGVCGGLSKYLNYPVATIRAAAVILALPALLSVFAYFILWYLLPEEPLYDKNGNVIDTGKR